MGEAAMIPRTVHRIWFGDRPMPAPYRAYKQAWKRYGYDVLLWTEANLPAVINRAVWDRIGEGVNVGGGIPDVGVAVQRADLASYELLWRFGGIYANCDIEPLDDLHDLIGDRHAFVVAEDGNFKSNALMGGTKGHPFWRDVIDALPARYESMRDAPMNEQTGPHLLTDCWAQWDQPSYPVDDLWNGRPFFPYSYGSMHLEGDPLASSGYYVEHHWGHRHPELLAGG